MRTWKYEIDERLMVQWQPNSECKPESINLNVRVILIGPTAQSLRIVFRPRSKSSRKFSIVRRWQFDEGMRMPDEV